MIDTEDIMSLWKRFTAYLSGWPIGTKEGKKLKEDDALFKEEAAKAARTKNKPKIKPKKIKGLNPKKKKAKVKKQGNIS